MLARPQIEGLRPLFAWPHLELHLVALAQVFELDLRPEPRAMKEHIIAAIVGLDEAESLVLQDLLDTAGHRTWNGAATWAGSVSPGSTGRRRRVPSCRACRRAGGEAPSARMWRAACRSR